MTLDECKAMREEMNMALRAVGEKYGVNLEVGNMTYDELGFTAKLIAKEKSVNGKSYEQAEFDKYCTKFGFSRQDYMMCVKISGVEYALVGFFPQGRKYTCRLRAKDGSEVKASRDCVIANLVSMNV